MDAELRALEREARHDPEAARRLGQAYRRVGLGWHGEALTRTTTGVPVEPTDAYGVYAVTLPNGERLELVHVPPDDDADEDAPTLSFAFAARARGYYLGRYPVTWAQIRGAPRHHYAPTLGADPERPLPGRLRDLVRPPRQAPLAPAVFANHRAADAMLAAAGLRLPTLAEWHRAAGKTPFPWGDAAPSPERCVLDFGRAPPGPEPVARPEGDALVPARPLGAAACGAMDMVGNVEELLTDSGLVGLSFLSPAREAAQFRAVTPVYAAGRTHGFRAALDALPRPRRRPGA